MSTFIWFIILLAIFLLSVSVYFFMLAICRRNIFGNKKIGETSIPTDEQMKKIDSIIEWLEAQNIENVYSYGRKAVTLKGQLIQHENSKKFIVLVHGYRSNPIHTFAYIIKKYYDMGFSILMPIQRAHEGSEGKFITFGYEEGLDMFFWTRYLTNRFGSNISIVFHGVSMGASTVAMMTGLNLPKNIKGIIADCGYSSTMEIFKYILMKDFHIPKLFTMPILKTASFISEFIANFPFDECEPVNEVKNAKVPMLFIHGTADKFVPYQMSVEMYEACASKIKELVLIEGASHGMSYLTDTPTCDKHIDAFFDKIL